MDRLDTIIQGEAIETLKLLPAESVNLLCTDPPYAIGTTSHGNVQTWLDNIMLHPFCSAFFGEIKRVLKPDGEFYINCDWRTYPLIYPMAAMSMKVRNCIVWDYEWIKAGSHYRFSHEFIIYGTKSDSHKRSFSASERDVWRIKPMNFTAKNKLHQAQKPEDLIAKMISNSSKVGDVVLDPFAGSGTTVVVAERLGRHYIGIELSPAYVNVARNRLGQKPLLAA